MQLSELKKGEVGRIRTIESSEYQEKLMEMGCVPGAMIQLVLKAPLGDPLAFELEGYTLSMRKSEAKSIGVDLVQPNE